MAKKFTGSARGEQYGQTYGRGDVVGCGVHNIKGYIFFTKNGSSFGKATDVSPAIEQFPTVGLHAAGEKIMFNFGASPFVFDLDAFIDKELAEERAKIAQQEIPRGAALAIVRQYLVHAGFANTLQKLDESAPPIGSNGAGPDDGAIASGTGNEGAASSSDDCARAEGPATSSVAARLEATVYARQKVRSAICGGEIVEAIAVLNQEFPRFLEERPPSVAAVMLLTQHVVELVRRGLCEQALEWVRTQLPDLRDACPQAQMPLTETVALLAYENPEASELGKLHLHVSRRQLTAELVNQQLVTKQVKAPVWSALHVTLRHLVACRELLVERNHGRGPRVSARLLCCAPRADESPVTPPSPTSS
mmetsp:Transcript_99142/g.265090  ORF Transcript_99142/g.265090 Transcript_99142/m.265090 type:complete len:363 (+) Transcript_99142:308-1396(+)